MDARRAKNGRSQGLVHDSWPGRGEPGSLQIQEIPEALATPDLQRGSLLVFSDLFADFSAHRAHVTAPQAVQACRPVYRSW